jgi:hypothetical protein
MKKAVYLTALSILIFFSISFVSILIKIPPFNPDPITDLKIGLPYQFYHQFVLSDGIRHSWNGNNLIKNCLIVWLTTVGIGLIIGRFNKLHTTQV